MFFEKMLRSSSAFKRSVDQYFEENGKRLRLLLRGLATSAILSHPGCFRAENECSCK